MKTTKKTMKPTWGNGFAAFGAPGENQAFSNWYVANNRVATKR